MSNTRNESGISKPHPQAPPPPPPCPNPSQIGHRTSKQSSQVSFILLLKEAICGYLDPLRISSHIPIQVVARFIKYNGTHHLVHSIVGSHNALMFRPRESSFFGIIIHFTIKLFNRPERNLRYKQYKTYSYIHFNC